MRNPTYEVEVTTNSSMTLSSFRMNNMNGAGIHREFSTFLINVGCLSFFLRSTFLIPLVYFTGLVISLCM